jgi:LacI family transcriptional regulator
MDDVARAAGVSKATVSRVLSGNESGCTPATAENVRQTAARLGYVVNAVASSLRSRQSFTIGLVLADVSNPFFGGIASGVETRLSRTGYSVILGNTGNSFAREKDLVRVLVEKQIDGLIVATSASSAEPFHEALSRGVHLVLVDSEIAGMDADCITIDNHAASALAVQHLLDHGHRRIAIVTGPLEAAFDRQRLEGYRAALAAAGISFDEQLVLRANLESSGGETAAAALLAMPNRPTAVFATNNMMTLGMLVGLTRTGISIPADISLIGFDDQDWYSVCHPPLTGITNPAYEMGYAAAARMLTQLGQKLVASERVMLESHLIERASVATLLR